jgi:hypothetical protein
LTKAAEQRDPSKLRGSGGWTHAGRKYGSPFPERQRRSAGRGASGERSGRRLPVRPPSSGLRPQVGNGGTASGVSPLDPRARGAECQDQHLATSGRP